MNLVLAYRISAGMCFAMAALTFLLRGILTDWQVKQSQWIIAHPSFLEFSCLLLGVVFILAGLLDNSGSDKRKSNLPLIYLGVLALLFRRDLASLMMRFVIVPCLDWESVYRLYSVASLVLALFALAFLMTSFLVEPKKLT